MKKKETDHDIDRFLPWSVTAAGAVPTARPDCEVVRVDENIEYGHISVRALSKFDSLSKQRY